MLKPRHLTPLALIVIASLSWAGCATSSSTTTSETSTTSNTKSEGAPPSVPTPEELKGSPCGNPEWAKLPDEHNEDGTPENSNTPDQDKEPSDEDSDDSTSSSQANDDAYACRPVTPDN